MRTRVGATGAPLLEDLANRLECRVEARLDTGDRTLFLAEVIESNWNPDTIPLTARRLSQLASSDQLRLLKEAEQRDIAVDAGAIHVWRQRNPRRPDAP